jgi:serine protease Do
VLLGGPQIMRQLAYAQQAEHLSEVRQNIKTSRLAELSESFKQVARAVEPSVVHIAVSSRISNVHGRNPHAGGAVPNLPEELRRFFPDFEERFGQPDQAKPDDQNKYNEYDVPQQIGNGSGWVYGHNGKSYVITNNHVVKDADEITVKFFDKSTRKATVVGTDPQTDIAVLEVETDHLHPAELANEPVEQGEMVFAFGSPFQFEFSMSQGIVSGSGRRLGILGNMGYENFIQTDAAINPGNSGGPLTNIYGQVVGMNTAIATRTGAYNGIGFAIPADMLRQIADQIIDKGKVSRGYLGVWISEMDPKLAKSFGFEGQGVLVDDMVDKNSPAAKAGMKAGDIITEIEGRPVTNASQLRRVVAAFAPGHTITIKVFRAGETRNFEVTLTEQPKNPMIAGRAGGGDKPDSVGGGELDDSVAETLRKFGLEKVETFTKEIADRLELEFRPGVVIEDVRSGSVAAQQGLRPGIVILDVQGKAVENLKLLNAAFSKLKLTEGVRLRVQAGPAKRFILLELPEE